MHLGFQVRVGVPRCGARVVVTGHHPSGLDVWQRETKTICSTEKPTSWKWSAVLFSSTIRGNLRQVTLIAPEIFSDVSRSILTSLRPEEACPKETKEIVRVKEWVWQLWILEQDRVTGFCAQSSTCFRKVRERQEWKKLKMPSVAKLYEIFSSYKGRGAENHWQHMVFHVDHPVRWRMPSLTVDWTEGSPLPQYGKPTSFPSRYEKGGSVDWKADTIYDR